MRSELLRDAALVLVGHGSTVSAECSAPIYRHATALRKRGVFGQVAECFLKQEPKLVDVVRGIVAPRVFVVPIFISEGYYTEGVIPRMLGLRAQGQPMYVRTQQRGDQTLHYCEPVGTHPRMAEALLARARSVLTEHTLPHPPKPEETALFIAGHGTEKNGNSRKAIEQHAQAIRALGLYAEVHAVFLEERPRIADCHTLTRLPNLIVVPCFISDGMHSYEDIPVLLGKSEEEPQTRMAEGRQARRNPIEKHGKQVWYSESIGSDPLVTEVILERVQEAAGADLNCLSPNPSVPEQQVEPAC